MKAAVLLLAFAAIAFAADDCLDNSYATVAVSSLVASSTTWTGLTTNASINTALTTIGTIVNGISSPWVQNVQVGLSNDDYYMIKNCRTQDGPNGFCGATPQWLAYVRNTAVFGDNVRHVFKVTNPLAVDITVAENYVGAETVAYAPTAQAYYPVNQTSGQWTGLITFNSGGSGKIYSASLTGGVAAASRTMQEPCGECFSNSWAIPAVRAISTQNLASYRTVTNSNQFSSIATILQKVIKDVGGGYQVTAYVAFDNGDSYTVKNCNQSENIKSTPECANRQWLFYTRNVAVLGNASRFIYDLSDAGAVGTLINVTAAAYNTTGRPFYRTQNGWSEPYPFASSSLNGNTFTASFNGGVIASDRIPTEPCTRVTAASAVVCPTSAPAGSGASASAVVFAALSVAAIAFVAL